MLCGKCQNEVAEGSKFCYNCGAQLTGDATPAAAGYAAPAKRLMRAAVMSPAENVFGPVITKTRPFAGIADASRGAKERASM